MQRRAFVRRSLATALFAPATLSLPELAFGATPRRGIGTFADPVRLSSNENPLGVPEFAKRAIIDGLVDGNRYPGLNGTVAARIASKLGVAPNNVVLGNGSAEILQMVVQSMSVSGQGVRVVVPDPTFEQVSQYATGMGAEVVKVPLKADHTHDFDRMHDAVMNSRGPVLAFVCNPNNPTGTLSSSDRVAEWMRSTPDNVWFLIDEAYFEFVDDPTYRTFVPDSIARPNTIVSRTFSKIYGLAGIRIGYGVGRPETMQKVGAFASGTNINHLASAAALACMEEDGAFVKRSLSVNAEGREFAYRTLRDLKLDYLPTSANFVMHRINGELRTYITRMREEGVIVGRQFPPMTTYNRVSIGTMDEMQAWAAALRRLRTTGDV